MMFFSSSLDKSCIGSDSCSPTRNNAPNRFSVGITPLGDENQQIRIQLAVHKYNNTANSSLNNRCSFMTPIRHSFLKNSLKVKNYEGDIEGPSKTEKRNGNQYEGVGAFPTIHLRKKAVRYRPIKRFQDVKIPYPELPVNRFLSNLPEVCPDLKSSTRSVLDVLEDLSGNKIHLKDEDASNKPKPKGLCGDYLLNSNSTVYKPLFVQKPKINSVLTRDNTTQTLSPVTAETPSPQSSSSCTGNGAPDPRAELRRKLAKQNNEIFASLSSSISSAFSLKRKIDKVLTVKDGDQITNGSPVKKTKTLPESRDSNENGISKSLAPSKTNSTESVRPNPYRKTKLAETSLISSNKDRLTTIFLDMGNTSPKAQMFQPNATSPETKSSESNSQITKNGFSQTATGFENKTSSPLVNCAGVDKGKNETGPNTVGFSFLGKTASEKHESDKCVDGFVVSKVDTTPKDAVKSISSPYQFGINAAEGVSFTLPRTPIPSASESTETSKNPAKESLSGKKEIAEPFTFEMSNDKPNFGPFKFETNASIPVKSLTEPEKVTPQASASSTFTTSPTPQFSFGVTSNIAVPTSAVQFGMASAPNTLTTAGKPTFTFGQTTSPSHQNSNSTKPEEKGESLNTSIATTTPSVHPVAFSFGQKPNVTFPGNRTEIATPTIQTNHLNTVSFPTSLNNNLQTTGNLFTFGKKTETPVSTPPVPVIATEAQKFPFSLEQKSDIDQDKTLAKKSPNLLEQKPVSQESTETRVTSPTQSTCTQSVTQTISQTVSLATAPQVTFSQNSGSQATNFWGKFEGGSFGSPAFNPSNPASPKKTLTFGTSVNGFGATTTQPRTGFGTSTSSASAFRFGASSTTQPTATFGVTQATQATSTFGASTTQSVSGFGNSQSTPTFGASTSHSTPVFSVSTSAPSFGVSTSQSTLSFGVSSTKQSPSSFGKTSTTQPTSTFGVSSQPTSGFGTSSTTQTTPALTTGFGLPSSQPNTAFGTPTSTQTPAGFGSATTTQSSSTFGTSTGFNTTSSAQATTGFGTPAATSTSGFSAPQSFEKKPVASLAQTSGIFGQTPNPGFSSSTTFNSTQNNTFAQKSNTDTGLFGQNKIPTTGFSATSEGFGPQNKFSFGMSTTNTTGFTTSAPSTTTPSVFSFGTSAPSNTFSFGSNSSGLGNTQTPFAFKSPTSEPFKFGALTTSATTTTAATEGTGFGGVGGSGALNFCPQINSNAGVEQKPTFNFGSSQPSTSGPTFNFGSTASPSVFNFGGSTSSASSGSSFSFGTPTPSVPFGQTASPGTPFAVPGTFSIGSGSSQSRPRASSRPRRRP